MEPPEVVALPSHTDRLCATVLQPAAVKLDQSAASSDQPAGEAPEGAGSRVVTVRVYPGPTAGTSQVRVVPSACSSAPTTGNHHHRYDHFYRSVSYQFE